MQITMILVLEFFQTTANIWELWFKVSLCWEPLRLTTWKAQVATKDYLKSPTANHKDWSSTGMWILPLIRQRSRHKRLCILLFSYVSAVFDSFSQSYGGLWKKNRSLCKLMKKTFLLCQSSVNRLLLPSWNKNTMVSLLWALRIRVMMLSIWPPMDPLNT